MKGYVLEQNELTCFDPCPFLWLKISYLSMWILISPLKIWHLHILRGLRFEASSSPPPSFDSWPRWEVMGPWLSFPGQTAWGWTKGRESRSWKVRVTTQFIASVCNVPLLGWQIKSNPNQKTTKYCRKLQKVGTKWRSRPVQKRRTFFAVTKMATEMPWPSVVWGCGRSGRSGRSTFLGEIGCARLMGSWVRRNAAKVVFSWFVVWECQLVVWKNIQMNTAVVFFVI